MKNLLIVILALTVVLFVYQRHQDSQRLRQQEQTIASLRRDAAATQKAQQLAAIARENTRAAYQQALSIGAHYRQMLAANAAKK